MSEWICAKDRLPEVHTQVLVYLGDDKEQEVLTLSYNEVTKEYEWDFPDNWINVYFEDVTHWMSLPEPPEK